MKYNKIHIFASSLLVLLPTFVGMLLWNQLPEQIPIHWNFAGEVDRTAPKLQAIVFLPLMILAIHLICTFFTSLDPKKKNINKKLFTAVLYICPTISIVGLSITYAYSIVGNVDVVSIMSIFMAVIMILLGNFLPKCQQNYTVGIKLPWTLENSENWTATHRFAGRVFVLCGILSLILAFFGSGMWGILAIIPATVVITIYSYANYSRLTKSTK